MSFDLPVKLLYVDDTGGVGSDGLHDLVWRAIPMYGKCLHFLKEGFTCPGSNPRSVRVISSQLPGRAGPPKSVSPTRLRRAMGMRAAGTVLSQPPRVMMASAKYPSCMISMQSAMVSLEMREYLMALEPFVRPSLRRKETCSFRFVPVFSFRGLPYMMSAQKGEMHQICGLSV